MTRKTIIVTLSAFSRSINDDDFVEKKKKKQKQCCSHTFTTLYDDDFMMSSSSLSFVHPKNGFHPIREKSRSNVMKKQRRRRRLQANTPLTRAMAAVQDEEATKPQPEPANWEYKYLYDGACPVCRSLKAGLEGKRCFWHFISSERSVCWVGFLKYARVNERAWISNDS